jgi:hypothetical protein
MQDGSWTLTNNVFVASFYTAGFGRSIITDPLPAGGYIYAEVGVFTRIASESDPGPIVWGEFSFEIVEGTSEAREVRNFVVMSNAKTSEKFEMGPTRMGDGPSSSHPGALFYSGAATSVWTSGLDAIGRLIHNVVVMNFLRLFGNPRDKYDSLAKTSIIDPSNVIVRGSKLYRVLDADQDHIRDETTLIIVELADNSGIGATFVYKDETDSKKTTTSVSGVLSSGSVSPSLHTSKAIQQNVSAGSTPITFVTPFLVGTTYDPKVEGWELVGGNETGNKITVKVTSISESGFTVYAGKACRIKGTCTPFNS